MAAGWSRVHHAWEYALSWLEFLSLMFYSDVGYILIWGFSKRCYGCGTNAWSIVVDFATLYLHGWDQVSNSFYTGTSDELDHHFNHLYIMYDKWAEQINLYIGFNLTSLTMHKSGCCYLRKPDPSSSISLDAASIKTVSMLALSCLLGSVNWLFSLSSLQGSLLSKGILALLCIILVFHS